MMKKTALLFPLITATTLFSAECGIEPSWWLEVRHIDPKGVGYDEGYTTADLFITPPVDTFITSFLNLRGHVFNDGRWAANVGLGSRVGMGEFIGGLNIYYDYRDVKNLNSQSQIGAGVELLSTWADLRLNGYAPVGSSKYKGDKCFSRFRCNEALGQREIAATLPNIDLEIGGYIPGWLEQINCYAALGTYYLFEREVDNFKLGDAWGVRGRVDLRIFDGIRIGGDVTYDKIFNVRGQGYIGLSLPLGPANMRTKGKAFKEKYPCQDTALDRARLLQPVYRQEIIPVEDRCQEFSINECCCIRFVCNTATCGNGTFECPYPTLIDAENGSCPGDIIYVLYGDGTSRGMDEGIILQQNQRLISSAVPFCLCDFCIPACTPWCKPLIQNFTRQDANGFFFGAMLADCNEVAGFFFDGEEMGSTSSITSYSANSFTLRDNEAIDSRFFLFAITDIECGAINICNNKTNNIDGDVYSFEDSSMRNSCFQFHQNVSRNTGNVVLNFNMDAINNSQICLSCNHASDAFAALVIAADEQIHSSCISFTDNSMNFGEVGVVLATPIFQNSSIAFAGNTFWDLSAGLFWTGEPSLFANSTFCVTNNYFTAMQAGVFFNMDSMDLVNSSLAFNCNRFIDQDVAIRLEDLALDGRSSIDIECNTFQFEEAAFGMLGAQLTSGSEIVFSNNSLNLLEFAFSIIDGGSTGGSIEIENNFANEIGELVEFLNTVPLDTFSLQNNVVQNSLFPTSVEASLFETFPICVINNTFDQEVVIVAPDSCLRLVGNAASSFDLDGNGGTLSIESPDLLPALENINEGPITVADEVFVDLGSCGCR